jgi:hypothetical protein
MGSSGGRHQIRLPIAFAHDITISILSPVMIKGLVRHHWLRDDYELGE